ncbi:MAG: hypothetical protein JWO30_2810 [Fibrobacteres bacterium]|nr:hypothetical protein [Fibrobacterota bacterium]
MKAGVWLVAMEFALANSTLLTYLILSGEIQPDWPTELTL